jgi:hypothetical protein
MYIASILHPDRCTFDIMFEADAFYRNFYGSHFDPLDANRSFSKPNRHWRWLEYNGKETSDNEAPDQEVMQIIQLI